MELAKSWYSNLSPSQRLKMASLTMLMGDEGIADALIDCNDIDELFESIANRVYAVAVQ